MERSRRSLRIGCAGGSSIRILVAVAVGLVSAPLVAQALTMADEQFMQAAIAVVAVDVLSPRCTAGPGYDDAQGVMAAWRRDQQVSRVENRMSRLRGDPVQRRALDDIRANFEASFAYRGPAACRALLKTLALPMAQFATRFPDMLAALGTTNAVADRTVPTRPAATPSRADTPRTSVQGVDRFGFHSRASMGLGGMIGLDIYPIVFFKDGSALTEIKGLASPDGPTAHRRAYPQHWTQWRRDGAEWQIRKDGQWRKLHFQRTYDTLPADFRLSGRYRSVGGTGNVAVGGDQSVMVMDEYLFSPDGSVIRSGAAGAAGSAGDIATTTRSSTAERRGRYRVNGLMLEISYANGTREVRSIVTDPASPRSVIWLDGISYRPR